MLADIVQKSLKRLKEKGLGDGKYSAGQRDRVFAEVGVRAYIVVGSFRKVAQHYRWEVKLHIVLVFKDVSGDEQRQLGVYRILDAALGILNRHDFGLAIDPLKPQSFQDITKPEDAQARRVVYQLVFETGFTAEEMDDETVNDLLRVGLEYYLQEPSDDGAADASDVVELSQ